VCFCNVNLADGKDLERIITSTSLSSPIVTSFASALTVTSFDGSALVISVLTVRRNSFLEIDSLLTKIVSVNIWIEIALLLFRYLI